MPCAVDFGKTSSRPSTATRLSVGIFSWKYFTIGVNRPTLGDSVPNRYFDDWSKTDSDDAAQATIGVS